MRERWNYCCFVNEQGSGHGAAMQLVARARGCIIDGFPLALRFAKHLFSLRDVCILEKHLDTHFHLEIGRAHV